MQTGFTVASGGKERVLSFTDVLDHGLLDGDFVVVRQESEVRKGDVVVAGIPGEEGTVKTFTRKGNKIVLLPANARLQPMEFDAGDVTIYGKVVTVVRRL